MNRHLGTTVFSSLDLTENINSLSFAVITFEFVHYFSPEPEAPQEEVVVTPEPQAEPEAEPEPEPAAVELKQEPVSQTEPHPVEKTQRAPPSPTPADTAPAAPEDNRVMKHRRMHRKPLPIL